MYVYQLKEKIHGNPLNYFLILVINHSYISVFLLKRPFLAKSCYHKNLKNKKQNPEDLFTYFGRYFIKQAFEQYGRNLSIDTYILFGQKRAPTWVTEEIVSGTALKDFLPPSPSLPHIHGSFF